MMMENVNYGREELLFLNICRKEIIGQLLHAEASYIHDLRDQMDDEKKRGEGLWRPYHLAKRNGNLNHDYAILINIEIGLKFNF